MRAPVHDQHVAAAQWLVHLRMEVEPVVVKKIYTVPNIYYDYDKADDPAPMRLPCG